MLSFNKIRAESAFSLVELIIVISIIGIISALLAPVILVGMDSWSYIKNRSELINDGRLAMNRMVREIREAGEIETWEDHRIAFRNPSGELISFRKEGTELLRNSDTLAENLKETGGLELSYLYDNGKIVRIKIEIIFENQSGEFNIKNQVYPRNL